MKRIVFGGVLGVNCLALALGVGATMQAPVWAQREARTSETAVSMTIVPAIRLGSDKRLHDAYTPAVLTGIAGRPLTVTVYNYDTDAHTMISAPLHLQVTIAGAKRKGVPSATTFTFTPAKAGSYTWLCTRPCDSEAKGWAMAHMGYMSGPIVIRST